MSHTTDKEERLIGKNETPSEGETSAKLESILLVEDDVSQMALMKAILRKFLGNDVKVRCAASLSSAIKEVETGGLDIVLLDLMLPDSHGLDTFREMNRRISRAPIVVMSNLSDESLGVEAVRLGAQDYLVKGMVDGDILVRSMRYAIQRKAAEESMKAANEKLVELDRIKSEFVQTVSHELRTPLSIIKEGVSLCIDGVAGPTSETQNELLVEVFDNICRLTRLVTDLLDISKIEAGRLTLHRSLIDVGAIVRKVCHSFKHQISDKNLELKVELPKDQVKLYLDEDRVRQILTNLMSNAIRFTHEGGKVGIIVTEQPDLVEFQVSDNGSGIPKESVPKLFSKFEQFGRTQGPGYRGTGLGLAIAKSLVESHGGEIWVKSELGVGTTFYFTLKKPDPPRIILVDEEGDLSSLAGSIQSGYSCQLLGVDEIDDALATKKNTGISLIVFSGKPGSEESRAIRERLKEHSRTTGTPLIIVGGKPSGDTAQDSQPVSPGIVSLPRPLNPDDLRTTANELLQEAWTP